MKLIALYAPPEDPEAFDRAYLETHLPLLERVPGLQETVITRFDRALKGERQYMMAEMRFADWAALKAGLNSPEMAAAGENLDSFAEGLVTLLIGADEQRIPTSGS